MHVLPPQQRMNHQRYLQHLAKVFRYILFGFKEWFEGEMSSCVVRCICLVFSRRRSRPSAVSLIADLNSFPEQVSCPACFCVCFD